jgi:two-component system, NarL family, sensor kinase
LRLNATTAQLVLRVTDTGCGFDPFASRLSGMGPLTMRERVELSGRTLTIESRRGGTTIEAVIPLGHSSHDVG